MTVASLRIGIVAPRFAPFRGGLETYVEAAAAALAAEGASVTVITQAPRAAELPREEWVDGYRIERHHLPISDVFDVPSPAAARAASRPNRFDVVWLHSYHTPLAWMVAERSTDPVVLTPHYHGVGHTPFRQALHRVYKPLGRRLMASSRQIVVDTEAEAGLLLRDFPNQVGPEKITVVPPIVNDPVQGHLPFRTDAPVVLTAARQEPYKRTDLLIRAVAELRDRGTAARLVVVGDGSALAAHRDLSTRLGADDVVTFTGAVDDETLGRWWASASLYASASQQEAYGIGLAEALVAGIPVAASAIPAHREVIDRAGSGAVAQLCRIDLPDADAATRYAEAITDLLAGSRTESVRRCALPAAAEVAQQLLDAFTTAGERTRSTP